MDKYVKRVFSKAKKDGKPQSQRQGAGGVASNGRRVALSRIIFDKYDKDGDGKMSLDEFKDLIADRGYAFTTQEAVAAFAKIDQDASGDIDYEEFKQFWKVEDRFEKLKLNEEEIARVQNVFDVFRHFDKNNRGALNKEEWNELRKHMEGYGYDMTALTYESIDTNGDGVIEFSEYLQLMIDTFHMIYDEED